MNEPLVIEPKAPVDSAIIWLHGLGSNKYDFEPIAKLLQEQVLPSTRFILPQAPVQSVSLNNGMSMTSWYDIIDLTAPRKISVEQLEASAQTVVNLIDDQHSQGIALKRIILAGFSQGGAVVMHAAYIAYQQAIGGVMALSTYAPTFTQEITLTDAKKAIPSLHLHGTNDPVVNISLGETAYQFLKDQGVQATWHTYPMQHEVCNEELSDIAQWLHTLL